MAPPGNALFGFAARHMLGLRNGLPGARHWRQVWSDHKLKGTAPHEVMALAHSQADADARSTAVAKPVVAAALDSSAARSAPAPTTQVLVGLPS